MRELTAHKINPANDVLTVHALDQPGSGGANHLYEIRGYDTGSNASDPFFGRYGKSADHSTVIFQNGPIAEVGVNGVTHEALLAILIDRLESFQRGPYASPDNKEALYSMRAALHALQRRTLKRMARGVEGTHHV